MGVVSSFDTIWQGIGSRRSRESSRSDLRIHILASGGFSECSDHPPLILDAQVGVDIMRCHESTPPSHAVRLRNSENQNRTVAVDTCVQAYGGSEALLDLHGRSERPSAR